MIDWKPIIEQYEECSSRLRSYHEITKAAYARMFAAKTREEKIQANNDYKRAVSEFNKTTYELIDLQNTIVSKIRAEIASFQ